MSMRLEFWMNWWGYDLWDAWDWQQRLCDMCSKEYVEGLGHFGSRWSATSWLKNNWKNLNVSIFQQFPMTMHPQCLEEMDFNQLQATFFGWSQKAFPGLQAFRRTRSIISPKQQAGRQLVRHVGTSRSKSVKNHAMEICGVQACKNLLGYWPEEHNNKSFEIAKLLLKVHSILSCPIIPFVFVHVESFHYQWSFCMHHASNR